MTAATLARPAALVAAGSLPVASYARRSKRAAGDGQGATINIADQHAQNRAYAAAAFPGAPVVEYDDNMTAWDPDAFREGWETMLDDVRAGSVAAVVGRYPDRLTRQPEQGEALLSACRRSGAALHTTSAGPVESALAVRILWAVAAEESDQKSRRMTDTHRRIADAGGFHGGRRRFGYTADMSAVVPAEADALADAAARVLAGESLGSITADWNARGILTPTGKPWRAANVGKLLRGAHLAGLRVHGDATTAAQWPAVFDAATHEAVRRFLTNPERRTTGYTGTRLYVLTGLLRCGVCDAPMYGRPTKLKSGPAYVCKAGSHTQAPVRDVNNTAFDLVVDRLSRIDASGVFVAPVDAERANARAAERAALVGRRKAMPAILASGISPEDYAAGLAAIDDALTALDDEAAADDEAARAPLRVLDGLTGHPADVTAELFDGLTFDRQRAVIGALGALVLARAARKGVGLPWDSERVTARWVTLG